jgi:tRNA-2-methylthio-N6-dimethylallyladenosine synthase
MNKTASLETPTPSLSPRRRKAYIKTYGCQMNVYDSERMQSVLSEQGYDQTDTPDTADLILLNTCHIREKAAEKVYSDLGRYRDLIEERGEDGNETIVGVAGCVAQAEGEEIVRRQPLVDFVVGPQAYHRLPGLLQQVQKNRDTHSQGKRNIKVRTSVVDTSFPEEDKFAHLPKQIRKKQTSTAFLTIQEGCDKFCAFCVVPYTRGAEVSRPVQRILEEAKALVDQGIREITLLGQNVNAYHGTDATGSSKRLADLIHILADIEGLDRIRYTTSHPNDMTQDLIDAHGTLEKLMTYLHLPIQSGSDKILAAMNRKHTASTYIDIIERIRLARPGLALSSDFIVGFPGETDQDFEDTLELVKTVGYAQAYSFKYSEIPGTPAVSSQNQIPEEVKAERLEILQALLVQQQQDFQQSCVGQTMPILLEKKGKSEGQLIGRSPYLQSVTLDAQDDEIGSIQDVLIVGSGNFSLRGKKVSTSS